MAGYTSPLRVREVGPLAYAPGTDGQEEDRKIARLIALRWQDPGRQGKVPPPKVLENWANELHVDVSYLQRAFALISRIPDLARVTEAGEVLARLEDEPPEAVVPALLEARFGRTRAWITHVVQYPSGSEVDLRLRTTTRGPHEHVRAAVELGVAADDGTGYVIVPQGGHSGMGTELKRYIIAPRLPDDLHGVTLRLVPEASGRSGPVPSRVVRPQGPVNFGRLPTKRTKRGRR